MASLRCDDLRGSRQSDPSRCVIPGCDLRSAESLYSATECGTRSGRHLADPLIIRVATGRSRKFRGLATGYAKKWLHGRPAVFLSPDAAIVQSGSPGPGALAVLCQPSPPVQLLRTSRLPGDSAPSQTPGTSVVYEQYGKAARDLRWRNRSNNPLLALLLARLFAACTSALREEHAGDRVRRLFPNLRRRCRAPPTSRHKHTAQAAMRLQVHWPEPRPAPSYPVEC